jgi:glycosyltransferase involved in cell wall biosynthesis
VARGTEGPSTARSWRPHVSVVIPARNEAANLPFVLTRLPSSYEVIVVDGHSSDDTLAVAEKLRPDAILVRQHLHGKGDAISLGFRHATGDIIVMADADGSMDAAEIPRFIDALLGGADFVKGSRFLPGGGSSDITRLRAAGNRGLTVLVNVLFRTRYTDLCYGFMALWRDRVFAFPVASSGFEVEALMNISAAKADLVVVEVPSHEGRRLHGQSNLSAWRDGWKILRTIVAARFRSTPLEPTEPDVLRPLQEAVSEATSAGRTASR